MSRPRCRLLFGALLIGLAAALRADDTWDGGGGANDAWSAGANWLDESAPANPDTGYIYFRNDDVGNVNAVDTSREVRYLYYTNNTPGLGHTTDLGGNTLTVTHHLLAGRDVSNTLAAIQNGTLVLGRGTYACHIYAGYRDNSVQAVTNCRLTISGNLAITNGYNLYVGFGSAASSTADGELDLSGTSITSQGEPNVLRMRNAFVSYRATTPSTLRLPASLEVLELTENLYLGVYGLINTVGSTNAGMGILDFGPASSVTNIRVRGHFLMGDQSNNGMVTNLPAGVHLEVGTPSTPTIMRVSEHSVRYNTSTEAMLTLSGGRFTAYLSELGVGTAHTENEGTSTGVLDVGSAVVQIGPEPDQIIIPGRFRVCSGDTAYGQLVIPSNITAISVGEFSLGRGSRFGATGLDPQGFLDIGSNSQLRSITATNGFYYATENGKAQIGYAAGGAFVHAIPTGLVLSIGGPGTNVPLHVATGGSALWYPRNTGTLELVEGTLRAHLSELLIGCGTLGRRYAFHDGALDLGSASVQIGDAQDSVKVDTLIVGGATAMGASTDGGKGRLILPASVTNVSVGHLQVGCAGEYLAPGGDGVIEFAPGSQLRTFAVAGDFWMGAFSAETGRVAGLPTDTGLRFTVGSPSTPVSMVLGHHTDYDRPHLGNGQLRLTNATFAAWLTNLVVGVNENLGAQGQAVGALDLTNSSLEALEVSGPVVVGYARNTAGSKTTGTLALPRGIARAQSLSVGAFSSTVSEGLVELQGTRLIVDDAIVVNQTGDVVARMRGASAGLDLASGAEGALSISNGATVHLAFETDPDQAGESYWGLRMRGDHTNYVQSLRAAGRITWTTNALSPDFIKRFGIHYSAREDATYVGVSRLAAPAVLIQVTDAGYRRR